MVLLPLVAVVVDRLGGSLPMLLGATLLVGLVFMGTISLQQQQQQQQQLHVAQPQLNLYKAEGPVLPVFPAEPAAAAASPKPAAEAAAGAAAAAVESAAAGIGVGLPQLVSYDKSKKSDFAAAADSTSWGVTAALLLGTAEAVLPSVLLAAVAHSVK